MSSSSHRRVLAPLVAAISLSALVGLAAAGPVVAAAAVTAGTKAPTAEWPEAHANPQLTGVSSSKAISTANAAQLGVHWMTNLESPSLSSPVIGYNQALSESLVYAGTEGGWFSAFNASNGKTVWSVNLGSPVRSTPVIDGPYVWVADVYSPELFKLNAATGAELCQTPIYAVAEASPIVVIPAGGSPTVFMGSNDLGQSGPLYSINEATCAVNWQFTDYGQTTGLWDFISYAVNGNGVPLVLFGTADPDSEVYAVNALTGALVWKYATYNPPPSLADVAGGVTISAPGVNGFADGVGYVTSKDGYIFALDLDTGALVWEYNYDDGPQLGEGSRSTAALVGNQVVFGTAIGTFDLNATTGALNWHYTLPTNDENLGAVAIMGPAGSQVVLTTNTDGQFQVLSLATGALLYSYQTTNYIASSPAVIGGNVLFTAADGFLYDFALGGGNPTTAPTTAVTAPAQGSTVANPNGSLTISGTASDPTGVTSVTVAVQEDSLTGQWWSATAKAWEAGPSDNEAKLASPGATTTTWSLRVPMETRGTLIQVYAAATDSHHVADTTSDQSQDTAARVTFTVLPSTTAPTLELGVSRAAPGSQITVNGGGYQSGESVALTLATQPVTTLATVTATSTGALPATAVTLPTAVSFGPRTVTATGLTSGRASTAGLIISNNWDQFAGSATRNNFEPNDPTLNNSVSSGGPQFLDQAYNFPTGSPIRTSVAIDDGVAFFGDDAGNFYAVTVSSGAPVWEDSYTAGIDSSAAVDDGLVIFGTEAHSVVAVNEQTGAAEWSTTTGAAVESSPAVYDGVVYVGSDNGVVYALNEQTGAVEWSHTLGGPVMSSPAIDTADGYLVVGDSSGHVSALSIAGSGSLVWSTATDGAVTATPIYTGKIFVGSEGGVEYALGPRSGVVLWTYQTGGPIVATNVEFAQEIAVGSGDGIVTYLTGSDGDLDNTYNLADSFGVQSGPIVGMTGSVNFLIVTTTNGAAVGTRITGTDAVWQYQSATTGFDAAAVINNGNVYVGGLDDNLQVFTAPGSLVY